MRGDNLDDGRGRPAALTFEQSEHVIERASTPTSQCLDKEVVAPVDQRVSRCCATCHELVRVQEGDRHHRAEDKIWPARVDGPVTEARHADACKGSSCEEERAAEMLGACDEN